MFQANKSRFFVPKQSFLICLISLVLIAGNVLADGNTFKISGRVLTEDGLPAPNGTVVRLENQQGALVAQRPVDTDGGFVFDSLAKGTYHLTASAKGFNPAEKDIDQRYWISDVFVRLTLTQGQIRIRETKPGMVLQADNIIPKTAKKTYEKGKKAYKSGDLPRAEEYYEQAVKEHACYPEAQVELSIVAGMRHEYEKTESALRTIVSCAPNYLPAYFRLAYLLNAEKRYHESVDVLNQALGRAPASWELHHELAVAQAGLGNYLAAEKEYREILSLTKDPPPRIHAELANVFLEQDKYSDAYQEMQAYLKAAPKGDLAPSVRKSMQEMKSAGVIGKDPE